MRDAIVNAIINLFLMLIALWSVLELIYDRAKPGNYFQKIKNRGKFLILCAFGVVLFNFYKDLMSFFDKKDIEKRQDIVEAQHKRREDSLANDYNQKLANAIKHINDNHTSALFKWGLHYDSLNNVITKTVKDSLRNKLQPDLDLCSDNGMLLDSIKGNEYYFSIHICDINENANNIDVRFYFAVYSNGGFHMVPASTRYIPKGLRINTDHSFSLKWKLNDFNPGYLYVLIIGTCYDDNNQKHKIDKISIFNIQSKKFGVPVGDVYENIDSFFKKNIGK
ncbi:MAG TPA: hypothetical protein VNS58_10880 [Puia sp.]|nr:hypothetical protein [Puia sp.]